MNRSRRDFLRGAVAATALFGAAGIARAQGNEPGHHEHESMGEGGIETSPPPGRSDGAMLLPVETPDIPKLPWRMENGVKVFRLIPEVVKHEFLPGKVFDVWGFNGSMLGPTVEAAEGRLASGRARGATLRGILLSLMAAILVSGCAAAYAPAPLPVTHPASPAAPEAPAPQPSQAFRGESIPPAPAEEASAQGPHAGHAAMHGGH